MKNHRSTGPPGGAQIQAQLQALHVREDEPAQGKKRGRAAST